MHVVYGFLGDKRAKVYHGFAVRGMVMKNGLALFSITLSLKLQCLTAAFKLSRISAKSFFFEPFSLGLSEEPKCMQTSKTTSKLRNM